MMDGVPRFLGGFVVEGISDSWIALWWTKKGDNCADAAFAEEDEDLS